MRYKPDLLIISECENIEKISEECPFLKPSFVYWYGSNKHKGIGIFSFAKYKVELRTEFNPDFRYIIPLRVLAENKEINLFAIWAMDNKENHAARYIGQIWHALNSYQDFLNGSTILAGDFNSNKIWDRKGRVGNHSDVVQNLANKDIHSAYHKHFSMEHGAEVQSTFYLYRMKSKQYHLDYCFLSSDLIANLKSIEIGSFKKWISFSDHMPLIVDIDL